VVGAIIADIPMIDQVEIKRIRTGDLVEVDGDRGIIRILKRRKS
jgi:predicted aconitase with swiveling domain